MDEIRLPVTVTVDPNVVTQAVDDEVVLLHLDTEEYFSLDDVGTVMWQMLTELPSVEDVVTALLKIYDVEESRLRNDLAIFIEKLVDQKLISTIDA